MKLGVEDTHGVSTSTSAITILQPLSVTSWGHFERFTPEKISAGQRAAEHEVAIVANISKTSRYKLICWTSGKSQFLITNWWPLQ